MKIEISLGISSTTLLQNISHICYTLQYLHQNPIKICKEFGMIQLGSLFVIASIYACGGTDSDEPKKNIEGTTDNQPDPKSQEKKPVSKPEPIQETGPWPVVDWKFEGRKLKLKQPTIEKGEGNCEYTMNARIYNWMSDRGLRKKKIREQSPLIVVEESTPLTSLEGRFEAKENCTGTSNFYSNTIHFSPTSKERTDLSQYKIELSPDMPLHRDNNTSWWLYKGYKMTSKIPSRTSLSGKDAIISVKMRMIDRISDIAPVLRVSDKTVELKAVEDMFSGSLRYQIPNQEWDIAIETNVQGSYFIIEKIIMTVEDQTYDLLSLHSKSK